MAGKSNDNTTKIRCSFCGKTEKQVRKLIAGPGDVFICDECISLCDEILEDELQELYSDREQFLNTQSLHFSSQVLPRFL